MKTLHLSDLDGTLLRSDQKISRYTVEVINRLVKRGELFSYATARSIITARKVTEGLEARIPMILYNGAFVMENATNRILFSNLMEKGMVCGIIKELMNNEIYPIVYSMKDGKEQFKYLDEKISRSTRWFIESRKDDPRKMAVSDPDRLMDEEIFYVTCIGGREKLELMYEKYRNKVKCIYHEDVYSHEIWLEMMDEGASKAKAAQKLKTHLGCGLDCSVRRWKERYGTV